MRPSSPPSTSTLHPSLTCPPHVSCRTVTLTGSDGQISTTTSQVASGNSGSSTNIGAIVGGVYDLPAVMCQVLELTYVYTPLVSEVSEVRS